jgi:hypothetical protein
MISKRTQRWLSSALAITGFAVASIITSAPSAFAQPCEVPCPEVGQIKCCPGSSISTLQANGGTINFTALTNGCFFITSCTPPAVCQWQVNMDIVNFNGSGTDPMSGLTVNWRNDASKISTGSSIKSIDAAMQFPAEGFIEIWVEADIAGVPGVYRSTSQVRLENPHITSWDPFVNEAFKMPAGTVITLINDVTGDVMSLTDLTSILN